MFNGVSHLQNLPTFFIKSALSEIILIFTLITGFSLLFGLNPFGPKSDQCQFSPNHISRSLRVKVMRIITKLITKGGML